MNYNATEVVVVVVVAVMVVPAIRVSEVGDSRGVVVVKLRVVLR